MAPIDGGGVARTGGAAEAARRRAAGETCSALRAAGRSRRRAGSPGGEADHQPGERGGRHDDRAAGAGGDDRGVASEMMVAWVPALRTRSCTQALAPRARSAAAGSRPCAGRRARRRWRRVRPCPGSREAKPISTTLLRPRLPSSARAARAGPRRACGAALRVVRRERRRGRAGRGRGSRDELRVRGEAMRRPPLPRCRGRRSAGPGFPSGSPRRGAVTITGSSRRNSRPPVSTRSWALPW